jgi:hypothetical protein
MKVFNQALISFAVVLIAYCPAQAGLLFEPYLGYELTKNSITLSETDLPGAATGSNIGLRLGYKAPLFFWVALDASSGQGRLTYDNSAATDQDMSRTNIGVTAGIDLPLFLRLWVGQGFSDTMELKKSGATDKFKGTNTKVGLGLSFIPFVSVNIEYLVRKYTEASGSSFTEASPFATLYQKMEQNTVLLSLSVPLNL